MKTRQTVSGDHFSVSEEILCGAYSRRIGRAFLLVLAGILAGGMGATSLRAQTPDMVFANDDSQNPDLNRICLNDQTGGSPTFSCENVDHTVTQSMDVVREDVNGDVIPDFVFANFDTEAQVCINDGRGEFSCSTIGSKVSAGVAVSDVEGDDDNDIVFANAAGPNQLCTNDGNGNFSCGDISSASGESRDVAVGYLNGDTDPDVVFANSGSSGLENRVCLNDGSGNFSCSTVSSDANDSRGVTLGRVDDDNSVDAVFANGRGGTGEPNTLCTNDGSGNFTCGNAGQSGRKSRDVVLVNTDDDLDLDAVFANDTDQQNQVCTNDGTGSFSCTDISSTSSTDDASNYTRGVAAGYIDGDSHQDVVFANAGQPNRMCLGVGRSGVSCRSVSSDANSSHGVAVGNIDGDASVRLMVDTQPDDAQDFTLEFTDPTLSSPTEFKLDDDADAVLSDTRTFRYLQPGTTYTAVEPKTPGRWVLHDVSCDAFSFTTSLLDGRASIELGFGERATCTFTHKSNEEESGDGAVNITKTANPRGTATTKTFPFGGDLGAFTITPATGVTHQESNLVPGRYVVAEGDVSDYVLRDAACRGVEGTDWKKSFSFPPYQEEGALTFLVKSGETTFCGFTNDKLGTVTINKKTTDDGNSVSTSNEFSVDGGAYNLNRISANLDTEPSTSPPQKSTHSDLPPSSPAAQSYNLREDLSGLTTWVLDDIQCNKAINRKTVPENGDELFNRALNGIDFDLAPGETVDCEFTNIRGGGIIIEKDTRPNDPQEFEYTVTKGSSELGTFTLKDNSSPQKGDVRAGTYTITESDEPNWPVETIDCQDPSGGTTVDRTQRKVSIDLARGEVVRCTFVNTHPSNDYGDAPDDPTQQRYPTFKNHNGAAHPVVQGVHLGNTVDADPDGQPTTDARGDDADGTNDEDGVTFQTHPLKAGQQADIEVQASTSGKLSAWIDFNGDNAWQSSEAIVTNYSVSAGNNPIRFTVPSGASTGHTFARFRFSQFGGLSPVGGAEDGEVEDYRVKIAVGASSPDEVTAEESSEGVEVEWSPSDSNNLLGYQIYRDTAPIDSAEGPSAFSAYDSTAAGETSYVDTGVEPGMTYYYRITAVDSAGNEGSFSPQTRVFLYPEQTTARVNRSFGQAGEPEDYRLVALPGAVDRPISEAISGEAGTRWQAYRDDGSAENFLQKYDGSPAFNFRPGRGFWLTSTGPWSIEQTVPTVELREQSAVAINLHDGWNIISNPTGKDVAWSRVEAANPESLQPLWAFTGSFVRTDTFRSAANGEAFYFLNDTGLDSLAVPYPGAPKRAGQEVGKTAPELQTLTLKASGPGGQISSVRLGTAAEASMEKDRFDVVGPSVRFSPLALRVRPPKEARKKNLPARQRMWAQDVRPATADGQTYHLRLHGRPGTTVRLTTRDLHTRTGREATLLDPRRGQQYDLSSDTPITLEIADSTRILKVALGSTEYVQEQQENAAARKVTLNTYPEPVRRQATLTYTLPEPKRVRVALYDVLGRQVALLTEGRQRAGKHQIPLHTENLPSGTYFCRLTTGIETRTETITIIR